MVATLAQLHGDIKQSFAFTTSINNLQIFLKQSTIVLLLHLRHSNFKDGFLFWR
uniref:CHR915 n=1 Tax=Arundo donax TaxID=35708 RepID=A0A0A9E0E2_ARUDO